MEESNTNPLISLLEKAIEELEQKPTNSFMQYAKDQKGDEWSRTGVIDQISNLKNLEDLDTLMQYDGGDDSDAMVWKKVFDIGMQFEKAQDEWLHLLVEIKNYLQLDTHAFRYTYLAEIMWIMSKIEQKYPAFQYPHVVWSALQVTKAFCTYFFGNIDNTKFELKRVGDADLGEDINSHLDVLKKIIATAECSSGKGHEHQGSWNVIVLISKTESEPRAFEQYSIYALKELVRFNNQPINLKIVESNTYQTFREFYKKHRSADAIFCIGHGTDDAAVADDRQGFIFYFANKENGANGEYVNQEVLASLSDDGKTTRPKLLTLLSCANANWDKVTNSGYFDYFITSKKTSNDFAEAFCFGFLQGLRDTNNLDLATKAGQLALLFKNNGERDNFRIHKRSDNNSA